jgi:hypothetical protein
MTTEQTPGPQPPQLPPIVYGLALSEDEVPPLQHLIQPHAYLVTSLGAAQDTLAEDVVDAHWDRLEAAGKVVGPLVRARHDFWPRNPREAVQVMTHKPQGLKMWHLRNLLWMSATRSLVFMVDPLASKSLDLTMHLTAAKVLGATSIGIMPSELRVSLDTTQLTMVDVIVGEADARSLSLLLLSLCVVPTPVPVEEPQEEEAKTEG